MEEVCGSEAMHDRDATIEDALARLSAAADLLERAVERMTGCEGALRVDAEAMVGKIVATVESRREIELEQRLAAAEAELTELRAKATEFIPPVPLRDADGASGRKTVPASMVHLLAKQGVALDGLEAGALDAALGTLSVEQRIAVKAQLLRAGLV